MELVTIHNQFHAILRGFIAKRINQPADVDDILQEVFIKIATKIDSLSSEEKLKGWIFTLTRNSIIDFYRKKPTQPMVEITEELTADSEVESGPGLEICLSGFIQQLPLEYRDILIDSELNGIKQKDLTTKYNLAYPSVRSRIQRGRGRLKDMLLNCCQIELDSRGKVMEAIPRTSCHGCD